MNFSIVPFGCKVNQYQAQIIRESMISFGGIETEIDDSEILFVVGCLVTQRAQAECFRLIEKYRNEKTIIAAGCAGSKNSETTVAKLPPNNLEMLPSLVGFDGKTLKMISNFSGHTRAMVAIQYGCSNYCSYCIVPTLRGKPRNRELSEIVHEVEKLAENGHPEVVLCGTEIGHFNEMTKLLSKLSKTDIKRIRLSSFNPRHLTPELVSEILKFPKVAPHLHLPIQSGSNNILKKMRRGYTSKHFMSLVISAKKTNPDVGITTDIIIGFPGESEDDFNETLNIMEKARFSKCHVFPFSPRPNTDAFNMKPVHSETVTNRAKKARDLANTLALKALCDNIGSRVSVLVEKDSGGFTGSYNRVRINGEVAQGELVVCKIIGIEGNILIGEKV